MDQSRAVLVVVAMSLLAAAFTACGSSADTSQVSRAQFLALANGICTKGDEAIQAEARTQFPNGRATASEKQREQFALDVVAPNLQKQVLAIRKLGAPQGDEATVEIVVKELQAAILEVKRNPASFGKGNAEPLAKANKFAAAYGLNACAAQ